MARLKRLSFGWVPQYMAITVFQITKCNFVNSIIIFYLEWYFPSAFLCTYLNVWLRRHRRSQLQICGITWPDNNSRAQHTAFMASGQVMKCKEFRMCVIRFAKNSSIYTFTSAPSNIPYAQKTKDFFLFLYYLNHRRSNCCKCAKFLQYYTCDESSKCGKYWKKAIKSCFALKMKNELNRADGEKSAISPEHNRHANDACWTTARLTEVTNSSSNEVKREKCRQQLTRKVASAHGQSLFCCNSHSLLLR